MAVVYVSLVVIFQALIDSTSSESSLQEETGIRMVALFDHEEVGSDSAQGAGSPVTLDALSRITNSFSSDAKVDTSPSPFWIYVFNLAEVYWFGLLLGC